MLFLSKDLFDVFCGFLGGIRIWKFGVYGSRTILINPGLRLCVFSECKLYNFHIKGLNNKTPFTSSMVLCV